MSKRFGRNQKRRLMERVSSLEASHVMDHGLLDHMRQELDRRERTLRRVASIFGENWIGLEPKTLEVRSLRDPLQVALRPFTLRQLQLKGGMELRDYVDRHAAQLECMDSSEWIDRQRMLVHISVRTPMGEVSYAATEKALHSLPEMELYRLLSEQMTKHLVSKRPLAVDKRQSA